MNTSNDYTIESVKKTLKVLKLFDTTDKKDNNSYTLMDIVNKTGYNKSSVLRILYTLHNEHFIRFDEETKKYSLDVIMLRLGASAQNNIDIRNTTIILLKALCDEVNLVGFFVLVMGEQLIVIDKILPRIHTALPPMSAQIGTALPYHSSGLGKLYLSEKSENEIRRLLGDSPLPKFTDNTITNIETIISVSKECAKSEVAYSNCENEDYIGSISCPIKNNEGKMVAGVSLGGVVDIIYGDEKAYYEERLKQIAIKVSKTLGY